MKFKILKDYELRFYSDLIKRVKEESTSFAINRGNKYKGWAIVMEENYQRYPGVYQPDGTIAKLKPGSINMGIRLLTGYNETKNKAKNKKDLGSGFVEVEYGEYPQDIVDIDKQTSLDYDLLNARLTATGKEYISHDNTYGTSKKLIELADDNGNKYVNKNNIWYKVKPVKWIVDERSNLAMSKYILTGGVSFGDLMPTRYHYEYMLKSHSNVWGYLKVLEKELEPSIVLRKLDLTVPTSPYIIPTEPCDPIPGKNPFEPYDPNPWNSPWKITCEQNGQKEKVKTIGSK